MSIIKTTQIDRTVSVLTKSIRAITGRQDVKVAVVQSFSTTSIAYTDGTTIYLSSAFITSLNQKITGGATAADLAPLVAEVKGLLYHETGHVLFSPRSSSQLVKSAISEGVMRSLNILEDQRIETLILGRHYGHKPFLTSSTINWVLKANKNDEWKDVGHAFTHGRRYLPVELRRAAFDSFKYGPEVAQHVSDIIDEYRLLTFPSGTIRGIELAKLLDEVLTEQDISNVNNGEEHGRPESGSPETESKQRKVQQASQKNEERDAANEEKSDEGEAAPDSDGDEKSEDADDSSSESGESIDSTNDDYVDEGDSPEAEGSGKSQGSPEPKDAGSDSADISAGSGDAFEDALKDAQKKSEELASSGQAEREAEQLQEAVARERAAAGPLTKQRSKHTEIPVPELLGSVPTKVGTTLRRLTDRFRPAWRERQYEGHINPLNYRTRRPGDRNFFDQYRKGEANAASVEVVVLVDSSGSTNQTQNERVLTLDGVCGYPDIPGYGTILDYESFAAWAIKRSIDSLPQSRCTVIGFSSGSQSGILYGPDERAASNTFRIPSLLDPRLANYATPWSGGGGTDPLFALIESGKLFDSSKASNKLLVIITDGEWSPTFESHKVIQKHRAAGVATALFGIGAYNAYYSEGVVAAYGSHECEYATDVEDILTLPDKVKELVGTLLNNKLAAQR